MKKSALTLSVAASALCALAVPGPAHAQDSYMSQITMFGAGYCPRGWAETNGQTLAIASNTALFSLLGTTFGGNGQTTFALPDMRGRSPVDDGTAASSFSYQLGQTGGSENMTLQTNNLPAHSHSASLRVSSAAGNAVSPTRNYLAQSPGGTNNYTTDTGANFLKADAVRVDPAGGGQPFALGSPYTTLTFCIATQGIFPSRN